MPSTVHLNELRAKLESLGTELMVDLTALGK
jgi:glycine cleavage system regulatory protein